MSAGHRHPPRRVRAYPRPPLPVRLDLAERLAEMVEAAAAECKEREQERRDMLHAPEEEDERDYRDWLDASAYADDWDTFDDWSDDYEPHPDVVASWLDGSLAEPARKEAGGGE